MSLIYNVSEILLHFVTGLLYILRTNGLRAYRLCRYFMQTPTSKAFLRFRGEKFGGRSRVTRHQRTSSGNLSARELAHQISKYKAQ